MTTETRTQNVFHELVLENGRTFRNWGLSRATTPAADSEPTSYADSDSTVRLHVVTVTADLRHARRPLTQTFREAFRQ
jgi:hypothetical protein